MYPQPELARLAARKCALRARIRSQRASCAEAATRVTQPLRWLDDLLALWRSHSPLVWATAIPLGLLAHHAIAPRIKTLRTLLHWGPTALSFVRRLAGRKG
jgi:hypothetical protein